MKRQIAIALSLAAFIVTMGTAHADWGIGVGAEHMDWKETPAPTVTERGLRWAFDLTWEQSREPGFTGGYNFKYYVGNVDYDGALLFTGEPFSTNVHYRGFTHEGRLFYRIGNSPVDAMVALGWDHWRRNLSSRQQEEWDTVFIKVGGVLNPAATNGILGSAGVKYQLYTRENAHLTEIGFSQNLRLEPKRDFSLYATLGYRFTQNFDVLAYYEGYRFKKSDDVQLFEAIVWQPKSRQDLYGVKVQLNWR